MKIGSKQAKEKQYIIYIDVYIYMYVCRFIYMLYMIFLHHFIITKLHFTVTVTILWVIFEGQIFHYPTD